MDDFVFVGDDDWQFGAHSLSEQFYAPADLGMVFILGEAFKNVLKEGKELALVLDTLCRKFHRVF